MEVVEDMYRLGKVFAYRPDIGFIRTCRWRRLVPWHVLAHKHFQNGVRSLGALAVADEEYHRTPQQVQHQRAVPVSLTDGHLVDGDIAEFFGWGLPRTGGPEVAADRIRQCPN